MQTQKITRYQVPTEEAGRRFIAAQVPNAIENKNGFSMYESFIMVTKNQDGQYKRIVKESTPQGMICNV